jgi:hypothetical protein
MEDLNAGVADAAGIEGNMNISCDLRIPGIYQAKAAPASDPDTPN